MVSQMSDKYDRKNAGSEKQKFEADHVISYFKMEWKVLLAVTVSVAVVSAPRARSSVMAVVPTTRLLSVVLTRESE